jgi:uncharacterized membrane protein
MNKNIEKMAETLSHLREAKEQVQSAIKRICELLKEAQKEEDKNE